MRLTALCSHHGRILERWETRVHEAHDEAQKSGAFVHLIHFLEDLFRDALVLNFAQAGAIGQRGAFPSTDAPGHRRWRFKRYPVVTDLLKRCPGPSILVFRDIDFGILVFHQPTPTRIHEHPF